MTEPTITAQMGLDAHNALCASPHCRPQAHGGPRRAMRGSPLCDVCEDRAWEDWQEVARTWDTTVAGLLGAPAHSTDRVDGTPTYGLDLDERAVDDRAQVREDLRFWVHLLVEDQRISKAPDMEDVPAMARTVGTHIKHLTHRHDAHLAVCVAVDARKAARAVRRLSAPQRSRVYRPGIACVEHGVDELGQRVPCPGEYRARLGEQMTGLPDLVCSEDREHVLTPAGFRRLGRAVNKDAAARLLDALSGRIGA